MLPVKKQYSGSLQADEAGREGRFERLSEKRRLITN
jgi:hypothetical protein